MTASSARSCIVIVSMLALCGCQKQSPAVESNSLNLVSTSPVADLRKQARKLVKEPTYKSTPLYALLVFGKDMKRQSWLVVDGKTVYFDRNANGDLTDDDERIPLDVDTSAAIVLPEGYQHKGINVFRCGNAAGYEFTLHYHVLNEDFLPPADEHEESKRYRQERIENGWANATLLRKGVHGGARIPLVLCPRPEDAQISHIDGPLTFALRLGVWQTLVRGKKNSFDVHVGTPGIATRDCRYPVLANMATGEVSDKIHPVAEFEYPNIDVKNGPIKQTLVLDQRC